MTEPAVGNRPAAASSTRGGCPAASRRIPADEEVAVRIRGRAEPRVDEALAEQVHLGIVDALSRLTERAAVVALQPGLELPRLPVDEGAAVELHRRRLLGLPRWVDLPVELGRDVVLTGLEVAEDL